jgi:hypothetical protein
MILPSTPKPDKTAMRPESLRLVDALSRTGKGARLLIEKIRESGRTVERLKGKTAVVLSPLKGA